MFMPYERDVKKFELKQERWVVQDKLARKSVSVQVCICTDFKLNYIVENCDCKQIAKF